MSGPAVLSLLELANGTEARVIRLPPGALQVRFASLGLVVGASIEMLQSMPALVVRVGATTLALERELGAQIQVQPRSAA